MTQKDVEVMPRRNKRVSTEIPEFSIERLVCLYHTSRDMVSILFALKQSQRIYDKRVLGVALTAKEVFDILESYYDSEKNVFDLGEDGILGKTSISKVVEIADKLELSREAVSSGVLSPKAVNNLLNFTL